MGIMELRIPGGGRAPRHDNKEQISKGCVYPGGPVRFLEVKSTNGCLRCLVCVQEELARADIGPWMHKSSDNSGCQVMAGRARAGRGVCVCVSVRVSFKLVNKENLQSFTQHNGQAKWTEEETP